MTNTTNTIHTINANNRNRTSDRNLLKRSALVALAAGAVLIPGLWLAGGLAWGLAGWLTMTGIGLLGATWLQRTHGKPDAGFLVAMGTCMLARLGLGAAGASLAATVWGVEAAYAYLVGLAVGYFPLQAYELGWFFNQTSRNSAGAEAPRTDLLT